MHTPDGAPRAALIFRQVSFTAPAFDRLKNYQRQLERSEGRRVTNSEALDRLILADGAETTAQP